MDSLVPNNQAAPVFSLPALDGNIHHLEDWLGQVVILNFWSAECPWAERGDQELLSYLLTWGEAVKLVTIASNANETDDLLANVSARRGLSLVLRDAQQKVADLYQAQTTPHLFVIDTRGILRYQGALDNVTFRHRTPTRPYLRQAVEAVLAGKEPDPAQTPPYGCAIVRFTTPG
jgi:peroxiredoxin